MHIIYGPVFFRRQCVLCNATILVCMFSKVLISKLHHVYQMGIKTVLLSFLYVSINKVQLYINLLQLSDLYRNYPDVRDVSEVSVHVLLGCQG